MFYNTKEMTEKTVWQMLNDRADYAIRSRNRNLVYETYGAAKMAWDLQAISEVEFYLLNDKLVRDTLNNGRLMNEWTKAGCI